MKLNKLNLFYIFCALCLISMSVYKTIRYKAWDRYDYDAISMSPTSYPVHIRECYFITGELDDDVYAKTESVNSYFSNWGKNIDFIELNEKKRLPEKLVVSYFSYRDKKFYKDSIELPTQQIRKIFKEAIKNRNTENHYSYRGSVKGLNFLIGFANDGQILVWLRGIYLEKLILKTKLKPREPLGDDLFYEEPLSKEKYLNHAFENLEDSIKLLINNGYEAGANYADSPTHYIERNKDIWEYQKEKGIIE